MKQPTRTLGVIAATCLALGGLAGIPAATASPGQAGGAATQSAGTHEMSVTKYLYPTSRTMKAGDYATFTGTVKSGRKSTSVKFQHYQGGKFVTIGTGTVSSTGSFKVRGRITSPGARKVRMVIPGNSYWKTYYSYPATLKVYKWHYVADLPELDSSMSSWTGAVRVNGTYYGHSVNAGLWGWDGYRDVDLRRGCSTFNAKIGQADDSQSASGVASMEVLGDGIRLSADQVRFGQMVNRTVNMSGVLRLRLDAIHLTEDRFTASFGDAQVLCMW